MKKIDNELIKKNSKYNGRDKFWKEQKVNGI